MEVTNRYVAIKHHINGSPKESDFELKSVSLSLSIEAGSNDVIVKNIYVSIDPYQINRMKDHSPSQTEKVAVSALGILPGKAIDAYGVGRIVESGNPEFEKGDLVVGFIGWEEYSLVRGGATDCALRKIDTSELPLSNHVGILGLGGLTAYGGFFDVCKPKKGETLFVSAASGSVGSIVGQLAKLFGCYVVGCAGTKEKVDVLKDKLGFDAAFNYKEEPDLKSALKRYFPDGIDMYFDNVGGEMLAAAVDNMNFFGRIAVCGVISEYTDAEKRRGPSMINVVYKRLTIQGFLSVEYMHQFADYISIASDYLRNGKIHALEDISHGIESIPSAFVGLFNGDNIGKKMVQIADM
ncbi:hypothetical protein AQUCO_01300639v1 [Aquilegia coerulea]|uniref:Enoyl reductase (ER) domain-containing protein n=1 Tax=Aquilegia coerulea TaxID=218851 RepID=A0A2G5E2Q4_AQUCA|nr:hypothetical protein AQUCO_01300639v1 [Aquilegia coerulea]